MFTEWLNISGQFTPRFTPPPLVGSAMVFCVSCGYMVLFGGLAPWGATNYTWVALPGPAIGSSTVTGLTWVNITTLIPVSPSPRYDASMTYDAAAGDILLFGGQYAGGNQTFNDTWTFSGSLFAPTWTRLATPRAPSPRDGAELTYDARDGYDVLFGGYDDPNFFHDTWTFSGGVWTKISPALSPYERAFAGFVYDAAASAAVLTAGLGGSMDMWSFAGGEWTQFLTGSPMGARAEESIAFDPNGGNLTLFGGYNTTSYVDYADTWNFSATMGNWGMLPIIGPSGRAGAAMAFDPSTGYLVLFGGGTTSGAWDDDTWILGSWPVASAPFAVTLYASATNITAGGTVAFTATVNGGIPTYNFTFYFDDGTNTSNLVPDSLLDSVSHPFPSSANYQVVVVVYCYVGSTILLATANVIINVGTAMVPNWLPERDAYWFTNYGSHWSNGGTAMGSLRPRFSTGSTRSKTSRTLLRCRHPPPTRTG